MKKFFTLLTVAFVAIWANAKTVEFDFTSAANWEAWGFTVPAAGEGTDLDGQTITLDGITLSFAKGSGNTTVRIFQGSGSNEGKIDLRLYAGDVLTVSSAAPELISAIDFNGVTITEVDGSSASSFTYNPSVSSAQFSS